MLAAGYARSQIMPMAEGLQKRLSIAGRPPPLEIVDSDNPATPTSPAEDYWRRRKLRWWVIHFAGAVGLGVFTLVVDKMVVWQPVRVRSFLIGAWLLEALVFAVLIFVPAKPLAGKSEKPRS